MSSVLTSFHGGTTATSINNILAVPQSGAVTPMLAPNSAGAMPALSELRGFTTDKSGNLYVVNAYKYFSQILMFSPPAVSGGPWIFSKNDVRSKLAGKLV